MGQSAAIFDLDRTLLAGASGPVFAAGMRANGMLGSPLPGEGLMNSVFNAIGETLPAMLLARQGPTLAKGKRQADTRKVAALVVDDLVELLQPQAQALFDDHRANGRLLVLATTTPHDLVAPFAERIGFDHVVATHYGVDADGNYDGTLDGRFVWSTGKLGAVRDWAKSADVDLGESWFYSDSVYDTPLMTSVGHPVVVNPDPRMRAQALLRGWPILSLAKPGIARIPVIDTELQRVALAFARPELMPFVNFDIDGVGNVPASGPAIICGNHRSYFDVAALAIAIGKSGRVVRFLGKKEVFDAPVVGPLATALGGIRVERGSGSDAPLLAAAEALDNGDVVAIMPEGTIPRGPAFFEPILKGRWGAARLAALTRAPVVPVGLWGTENVWPRNSRVPHVWNVTHPPTVRIRVGAPVELRYRSSDADTKRIMAAIVNELPDEARSRRCPSHDELARTYPPGWKGDAANEATRRPGADS